MTSKVAFFSFSKIKNNSTKKGTGVPQVRHGSGSDWAADALEAFDVVGSYTVFTRAVDYLFTPESGSVGSRTPVLTQAPQFQVFWEDRLSAKYCL